MNKVQQQLKLEKRIHNQRVRLAWFEKCFDYRNLWWKRSALAYRKQLQDLGVTPNSFWSANYKNVHTIDTSRKIR